MEPKHEIASENNFITQPMVKHDYDYPLGEGKSPGNLEVSSSKKNPFGDYSAKPKEDGVQSASPNFVPSSDPSAQTAQGSTVAPSGSGTGNISSTEALPQIPEWNTLDALSMGPSGGYDPNRIPQSVFSPKPSTPMEWSVTSNESLFSIHMGNNSFSRDQAILLEKSGELTKFEEWNYPPNGLPVASETKSNESNFSSGLPPVSETAAIDNGGKTVNLLEDLSDEEKTNNFPKKGSKETVEDCHFKEKVAPSEEVRPTVVSSKISDGKGVTSHADRTRASSSPRLSNESGNSGSSFAFPILISDGGKNVSQKIGFEQPEKTQSQPQVHSQPQTPSQSQTPKTMPKTTEAKWFSWLSCWPRCC